MAIDCVPEASPVLKAILEKKNRRDEAMRLYQGKQHELKFMEEEFPKSKETRTLRAHVLALKKVFDRRSEEWTKDEKRLCPDCKGEQWAPDTSVSQQMGHSCHGCGGGGLLRDYLTIQNKRFRDLKMHFHKNPLPIIRARSRT